MNPKPLIAVMIFILIDCLTGLSIALITKRFCSAKMRKGLLNKLGELFAMILFYAITACLPMIGVNLPSAVDLPVIIAIYIIIMEIGSVVENIAKMNPELGEKIEELVEKEVNNFDKRN